MAGIFNSAIFNNAIFNTGEAAPVVVVTTEQASNWQVTHRRRLTEEELREFIRAERIRLGILPPNLPGQDIGEPAEIAEEVAQAVHDQVVMAQLPIDYETIYREAYLEAEHAIAEYRKAKRKRRIVTSMLLH